MWAIILQIAYLLHNVIESIYIYFLNFGLVWWLDKKIEESNGYFLDVYPKDCVEATDHGGLVDVELENIIFNFRTYFT